ncbi:formylmethanofuran dehydrogenase subunit B [Fuerstiella marisgermanici]|uniref:Formylmethanofuran dehydrogenase subunit B n=1 Tax=Fuerstiella marisgermanici TaxID=1891926 RepID=A0A1P8W9F7_9PLAN|nr:formylmethanofuran dehydrogenase subunit B [Fuerstiella marisgermanici]APZ90694.1 formylmethanofuran dehydrogenase subunit B [Fuerstiella marisgermanici]
MNQSWKNVPCPGCACVCDDITLEQRDDGTIDFQPDCHMGRDWFERHSKPVETCVSIENRDATLDAAIDRAASILGAADYPLIYGLSRSATPGQRAAVALGEQLGGVVDTTASLCHGPSIMALQEVGEVTSTLGEVANRADLVIFWGCNPSASHPRHAERYSVFPEGRFVRGRADRKVVMVGDQDLVHDWRLDPHGSQPDLVIPIAPNGDFDAVAQLRTMLHTGDTSDAAPELRQLMELMRNCRYGVVFFGLGLAKTSMWTSDVGSNTGHIDVAGLLQLVRDMNAVTRFTARRMRLQGDVSGADSVMCWQTGYPFGVDFSRGYPRYNPGEYTANELLERGDVDACVLVGAETVKFFSEPARQRLQEIPTVLIDYPNTSVDLSPTVSITTAVYGIHVPGTIYRMDNVPMSTKSLWPSDLPTDEDVLLRIAAKCVPEYASPALAVREGENGHAAHADV